MDYILGQAAIVNKGAWSSGTTYKVLNAVTHNGGTFLAVADNSGVEPGVSAGWASSWIAMAKGVKTLSVTAGGGSTATVSVTYSDGTTATAGTYSTAAIADSAVTTAKIADSAVTAAKIASGAVTAAKLGSDILPSHVGIKYGTATPTTSTISDGQIYLKYS